MEGAGVEDGSGLAGGARSGAGDSGVAERVHIAGVEAIQHIEAIGDDVEVYALAETNLAGDSQVNLKKAGTVEKIAAECADAADGRRWDKLIELDGVERGIDADGGNGEIGAADKGRRDYGQAGRDLAFRKDIGAARSGA